MAKENKSRYALLGALSLCPGSGYDIKKLLEQSTSYFWSESYGQIYPLLKQLEQEGAVTHHTEKQEGKPERYVYALTDQGRGELQRWLTEPVERAVERNELLLKLFFGRVNPVPVALQQVEAYRTLQEGLLRTYAEIETRLRGDLAQQEELFYPLLTVRYGIYRCRALVAWCDETLETLRAKSAQESPQRE
jgi:DNA-binding PadR family transcriptional regulator